MRTTLNKLDSADPVVVRECLRNMVALATLPAVWSGADPQRIAESLESLSAMSLPHEAKEEISGLKSSAEYLQKLSSGLRLLAVDPAKGSVTEPTELHEWWAGAVGVLRNSLPRGVALESRIPSESCWVRMGDTALTQAVFNLVQNAGDAMRDRGRGVVRVKLTRRNEFAWTGSLPTADELVEVCRRDRPDLVVLDAEMPGRDPFEALAELAEQCPFARAVIFTGHVRRDLISRSMEAGAWGYVSKSDGEEALLEVLHHVLAGSIAFSPEAKRYYDQ
jgi:CheY-like chemotaxis protein